MGDSALHIASNNDQLKTVEFLLKREADVDATNNTGDTALHGSAMEGHVRITRVLLEAGAGDQLKNSAGQRPMDLAKFWGTDTMVIAKYVKERNRTRLLTAAAERDAALSKSSSTLAAMSPEALRKLEAREAKRELREAERKAAEDGARKRAEAAAAQSLARRAPKQKHVASQLQSWGKSAPRAAVLREQAVERAHAEKLAIELAETAALSRRPRPKHTDPDHELPSFKTGGLPLEQGLISPSIL